MSFIGKAAVAAVKAGKKVTADRLFLAVGCTSVGAFLLNCLTTGGQDFSKEMCCAHHPSLYKIR